MTLNEFQSKNVIFRGNTNVQCLDMEEFIGVPVFQFVVFTDGEE